MSVRRLLMAEDDLKLSDMYRQMLQLKGCAVTTASDLQSAREAVRKLQPDVIVLDIRLGDENGLDLCREIRAESDVPIIFLTALDDDEDVVTGLEAGGDDYLAKPVNVKVLLAHIEALMRRAEKIRRFAAGKTGFIEIDEEKFAHLAVELSDQEKKVALLIALGASNQKIAEDLNYTDGYVRNLTTRIYAKTGTANRNELKKMLLK